MLLVFALGAMSLTACGDADSSDDKSSEESAIDLADARSNGSEKDAEDDRVAPPDESDQITEQPEAPETVDVEFQPDRVVAALGTDSEGQLVWTIQAVDGDSVLTVQHFEQYGAPTEPGTYQLSSEDTSLATCATCIVFRTGCKSMGGQFVCEAKFMPQSGGGFILSELGSEAGSRVTGEFQSIVFQEVEVARDLETTALPGGQRRGLESWAFDVEVEVRQEPPAPCGGHGHLHGSHCHCDPGYRIDPENSRNCIPD